MEEPPHVERINQILKGHILYEATYRTSLKQQLHIQRRQWLGRGGKRVWLGRV